MSRVVEAADGRTWTVRREINWSRPAGVREFENDVAGGQIAGVVMLVLVTVMALVVIFGAPSGVLLPGWLKLSFFALLLLIPLQWLVSRPWTIVAETPEPVDSSGEHWVGVVRGVMASRSETSRIARQLERDAVPDDGRGPLQPVS